jgi:hypothetical protein
VTGPGRHCGGHPEIGEELRAIAVAVLDRVDPLLERLRSEPAAAADATTCASCPVCALLAALRGERPELAVRLAEHTAGLVAVLRAALGEGTAPPDPAQEPPSSRRVQHIHVERQAR